MWDCASHKTIRTIANSGARITFSPDGRILASGSRDNVIMLWEVATGAEWRVLTNSGFVISLAISPDGQTLAASTWEGTVNLCDVSTGQQKPPLSGHTARVWSIGFSPDGQTLATASSDQSVGLWDVQTQRSKGRLKGHSSEVWSVVFLLDGKTLVSGSKDEALKVWSADRERFAADSDLLFHPVFAGDESGSKNSDKLCRVKGEYQPEFSDDGRYIASEHADCAWQ